MPPISAQSQSTAKENSRVRTLHLFTLCTFGITQPLLATLVQQTVYLHDQQFSWVEISIVLAVLSIALPLCVVGADMILRRLSAKCYGIGRNTVMIVLMTLVILSLCRPYLRDDNYRLKGYTGIFEPAAVFAFSFALVFIYERKSWLKSWLTLTSIGLILSPALFLFQFERIRMKENEIGETIRAKNPIPIVFIIFDELSGNTLLNEKMEIDSDRFPRFSRLAETSTWYRNATTVSPRTDIAVPAILSGRFPTDELPPLAAHYPGNLFQVIEATKSFEMVVFEPITRLCPTSIRPSSLPKYSRTKKCTDLCWALFTVYPHLIIPSDTPIWLPAMPREWFGLPPVEIAEAATVENSKGLIQYPGTESRDHQLKHFLEVLSPVELPPFYFLHMVLPHYPWTFLASGEKYQSEFGLPRTPIGARGDLGENWDDDPATVIRNEFRYRQQVGYVDRFIGQVMDRLQETNLLDRCLLIVTADHGVSFRPGHSRRLPDNDNLADILTVPLFIKLPGQSTGAIDDRNIESVDLLPTIADIIGVTLPEPVDGITISQEVRRPRKSLYYQKTMTVCEPDVPQRRNSIRHQQEIYGTDTIDRLPVVVARHPEWHGRSINQFIIDEQVIPAEFFSSQNRRGKVKIPGEHVNDSRFIDGILDIDEFPALPAEIVLAIDGIVRDTSKTVVVTPQEHRFEFLIPESIAPGSVGKVELFVADLKRTEIRLSRLKNINQSKNE